MLFVLSEIWFTKMASEEDIEQGATGMMNLNSSIGGKAETASNTSGSMSRKHQLIHQNSIQSNGLTMSPPSASSQINGHHHQQQDHHMHATNMNGTMLKQQQLPPPPPPHHQMGKLIYF